MRALTAVLLFVSAAAALPACNTFPSPVAPAPLESLNMGWTEGDNILAPGETLQFEVRGTRDGVQLTVTPFASWSSSDESVATVSNTGLVTAVGIGQAGINATYLGHGFGATIFVR